MKRLKSPKDRIGYFKKIYEKNVLFLDRGVTDMQWDPLSDAFLLVSFQNGDIALFNSEEAQEVRSFERQVGGEQCLPLGAGP